MVLIRDLIYIYIHTYHYRFRAFRTRGYFYSQVPTLLKKPCLGSRVAMNGHVITPASDSGSLTAICHHRYGRTFITSGCVHMRCIKPIVGQSDCSLPSHRGLGEHSDMCIQLSSGIRASSSTPMLTTFAQYRACEACSQGLAVEAGEIIASKPSDAAGRH